MALSPATLLPSNEEAVRTSKISLPVTWVLARSSYLKPDQLESIRETFCPYLILCSVSGLPPLPLVKRPYLAERKGFRYASFKLPNGLP